MNIFTGIFSLKLNQYTSLRTISIVSLLLIPSFTSFAQTEVIQSDHKSICINAIRTENFDLAQSLCRKQLIQAQSTEDAQTELSLLLALLDIYKQTGNDEEFDNCLSKIAEHPLLETSPSIKYQWLRLQAIKLHHADKIKQSNDLFTQAMQIAIDTKDRVKISNSNIDLGISAAAQGDYKTSLNHYRTSLDMNREMNDQYAIGLSLKSVGNVYFKLEEYESALKYYEQALDEYNKYIDQNSYDSRVHHSITAVYESLTEVNQELNNQQAVQKYQSFLQHSDSNPTNNHDRANELELQAKQLIEVEDYQQAASKLMTALRLQQSQGIDYPAGLLHTMAQVYQHLGQNDLAIYYATEGTKDTDNKNKNDIAISQNFKILSQLHADTDPRLALDYANKYNQSRDVFLATKYDTDLKTIQHQIELEKNHSELVSSQLKNVQQQVRIQKLNNKYLVSLLALILLLVLIIYIYFKKKREQSELKATIDYHKNQFAVMSLSTQPKPPSYKDTELNNIKQETVNQRLVSIMHDATNLWVNHTGDNLIEMADRSKIWTITNDNGTLRARSLDKYLSLQKIPKNPRWRNVVRTCHFVLSEPGLSTQQRHELNIKLESLMQIIKDFYGTGKETKSHLKSCATQSKFKP